MVDNAHQTWWHRLWPFSQLKRSQLRRQRIALARQQQEGHTFRDPIEDDPKLRPVIEEAHALAIAAEPTRGRGSCHRLWHAKKKILKERFGIEWFSPAEMNPGTKFD
jgi:hypothetical protein